MSEQMVLSVLQKLRERDEKGLVTAIIQTANSNHPYKDEMIKMIVEYGGEEYGIGFEGYLDLTFVNLEIFN